MKHIVKHLLIVCIATLGITSAIAQTVTTNNITIKDIDKNEIEKIINSNVVNN